MFWPHLRAAAQQDPTWSAVVDELIDDEEIGVHLAILVEPYLQFILERSKTVESRFSRNGCAPFDRVSEGDVVLLKRSSGPIVGAYTVGGVWNYRLTPSTLSDIRHRFGPAICPQEGFWEQRSAAAFATLMRVEKVQPLPDLTIPKRDRRGWVVLRDHRTHALL